MSDPFRTIGIDIGGTNIKLAVLWSDGRVIDSRQIATLADSGPEKAFERLLAAVNDLMQEHQLRCSEMRAVGMDSAGIIDPIGHVILDSPNLRSWERFPLARKMAAALGLPVQLENDVNAMAFAEWRCGAGRGARNLVCLTLGTGVGGGLILDGRLYRGSNGAAGEIGHVSLDWQGTRCNCPNSGCLEVFLGAQHIVERGVYLLQESREPSALRDMSVSELSPKVFSLAAAAGDRVAQQILEESGRFLGHALVGLVNTFNPELIVVGGGVARAGDWILEPARGVVAERAMAIPAQTVRILPAALGTDASLVGAALLALDRSSAD